MRSLCASANAERRSSMRQLSSLYRLAEKKNIPVLRCALPLTGSLSVCDDDGSCFIGIDPAIQDGGVRERVHLSHELGHCVTGSFYNRYAAMDLRRKHENRADRWAVRRLIPASALDDAVASGCTELWELAEHFGVTEEFMRKAVCLYTHGNMAAELYF